ncbi:MAG: hypothetical protein ACFE85_10585 [Candidatus Hodarchaeota archaeon]
MSSERNIDMFSGLVLILSVIALVMVIIGPFASSYIGGYTYYYSCLDCENSTILDYISQIFIIILLILQIIISLNNLLPNKFISKDTTKYGLILAGLTFIFTIIGLTSFGIAYIAYDWWPDIGFYGPIVAGLLNTILFYLKQRNQ